MKQDGGVGGSSHEAGNLDSFNDDSWKRLWKLPCPRNIQMFAWRLKHDSLAFRTHVARKGIPIVDTKCLFCGRADEDGAHLFIKCKNVKAVWREPAMERERTTLVKIGPVHAVLDFLWGLDVKKRLHILTFWWMWWSNRNKLRQGELPWPADVVALRMRSSVLEYLEIFGKQPDKPRPDMWRPPAQTEYKINVDGSFVPGQGHAGWGVVVRTKEGGLVYARAGRQDHVTDAFVAEIIAMTHAIHIAAHLGIVRVELETDSQLYLEDLKSEFERVNGSQIETAARPYAFIKFDTFIQKTRKLYLDTRTQRNLAKLNDELYEVHQIMTRNVQEVLGVGEKLDQVSQMSSRLTSDTRMYADKAKDLNRQALIRKYAPVAIVIGIVLMLFWVKNKIW
ncbi:25.3 kDa vesicle transport protein [Hordeum vulgare]|nr:25.3 kDa vesicle transport protein [Hordeum vulgare]